VADNTEGNEGAPKNARDWWRPGDPFPWAKFYWREWMSRPELRRLTRDERAGFMDVWAATHGTKTPGVMTEADVRLWAGYDEKEWKEHRDSFARCFNTTRQRGRWRLEDVIETWKAAQQVSKRFAKRARKGVEARRRKSSGGNGVTTRCGQQVQLDVDTDVRSSELKTTAVPDPRRSDPGRGGLASALPDGTTAGVPALLERALGARSANGTDGTDGTRQAGGGGS
jgi:hypothetical protein